MVGEYGPRMSGIADDRPHTTPDALAAHLDHLRLRGLSPNTIEARRWVLGQVLVHAGVGDPLALTEEHLVKWRAGLDGMAVNTVATYARHVRGFCRWALEEELMGSDPSRRLPVPETRRGLPRPIAEADLTRAVEAASPRIRLWLVLGGWCGLRAWSISRSRREDMRLDLTPPMWIVTAYAGKRRHDYDVPLSGFVLAEIEHYGLPESGWNFPNRMGTGHISSEGVYKACNRHLRSLGIQDSYHSTRHRFGSAVQREGHDIHMTAKLLGHANVNTAAVYAEITNEEAACAVDRLPTLRGHQ